MLRKKKNFHRIYLLIFAIVLLLFLLTTPFYAVYAEKQVVRVGIFLANGFCMKNEYGNYYGYNIEYTEEIAKRAGLELEYVELDITDCTKALVDGRVDVVGGLAELHNKENGFQAIINKQGTAYDCLYVELHNHEATNASWPFDKKIGYVAGTYIKERVETYLESSQIQQSLIFVAFDTMDSMIESMEHGELDGFLDSSIVKRDNYLKIREFSSQDYYYTFQKNDNGEKLMGVFRDAMNDIRQQNPDYINYLFNKYYREVNDFSFVIVGSIICFMLLIVFATILLIGTRRKTKTNPIKKLGHKKRKYYKRLLNGGMFEVFYQPIYNSSEEKIERLEALIRLKTRSGKFLLPSTFLQDLSDLNLMSDIGKYMIDRIQLDYKILKETPYFRNANLTIFINFSEQQLFDKSLVSYLEKTIEVANLPKKGIGVEVTEQVFFENEKDIPLVLDKIREIGCLVAMDDFGMQYSTLSMLSKFNYDTFKIDKYFVDNIETDVTNRRIVKMIVEISESLGRIAVAEGVETKSQFEILTEMGCKYVQGYYFARPMNFGKLLSYTNSMFIERRI